MNGLEKYRIEKREQNERIAYDLYGPRGAHYFALRNIHHPEMLFLVNGRGLRSNVPFAWLRETDDGLRVTSW